MKTSFIKMHGLGNDFVIFDGRQAPIRLNAQQAAKLADRRMGIGCDQVIVMEASSKADVFMRILNADGSEVSSCGNATRCVAWLIMQENRKDTATVETRAGIMQAVRIGDKDIRVDMGMPKFEWQDIPLAKAVDTKKLDITHGDLHSPAVVSMGNPHMVFVVKDVESVDLQAAGKILEHHPLFPERANVSIAQVIDKRHVKLRVWERGAGLTLACGTAACATVAALHNNGLVDAIAEIKLPGGTLNIEWDKVTQHIYMTGAVAESFTGEVKL